MYKKKRYVLICDTEDKNGRIYYDMESRKYGSIGKISNISNALLASCSTLGYVFLRTFQKYKLEEKLQKNFFLPMICGVIIGLFISILLNKKRIKLTYLTLTKEEAEDYIYLGKKQLETQKTGILFISFLLMMNTLLFLVDTTIVTFILEMLLSLFLTTFISYRDIFGRKSKYNNLINK